MTAIPTNPSYFWPEQNSTLACTVASASVTLGNVGDTLLIYNDGGTNAYLVFGSSTPLVATAGGIVTSVNDGGLCVPPGVIYTLRVDNNLLQIGPVVVAGITSVGTTTVRFSRGSGQ